MQWTETMMNVLRDNYLEKTHSEMAELIGVTTKSVKGKCQKLGLLKKKLYEINETYFDTWSHDMAYILGYIMADGCIDNSEKNSRYCLRVCLNKKDRIFIDFLNSKLCPDNYISQYGDIISVRYTSKYMVDKLCNLGVIPRKTGKETMRYIPEEWKLDFIRGYFDGDGSIDIKKNYDDFGCFICSKGVDIVTEIFQYFKFGRIVDVSKYRPDYNGSFYNWVVRKKCDLEKFRNLLYQTGSFCLTRKKERLFQVNTVYKYKKTID